MASLEDKGAKGGKAAANPTPDVTSDDIPLEDSNEGIILAAGKYSDDKQKIRSLGDIVQEIPESNFFVGKSQISIFRYEDVIFNIYPHLAHLKRRGQSTKEIFKTTDPAN